jgi:hypothetical protein
MSCCAPGGDLCIRDSAGLEAVGSEGAEGHGGGGGKGTDGVPGEGHGGWTGLRCRVFVEVWLIDRWSPDWS